MELKPLHAVQAVADGMQQIVHVQSSSALSGIGKEQDAHPSDWHATWDFCVNERCNKTAHSSMAVMTKGWTGSSKRHQRFRDQMMSWSRFKC